MNPQFSQPGGSVSKDVNKQSIARTLGIKSNEVAYLKAGISLSGYKALYDKETQLCFWMGTATGTITSWSVSGTTLNLVSTGGTFSLVQAKAGDWITPSTLSVAMGQSVADLLYNTFTLKGLKVKTDGTDQTTQLQTAINTAALYGGVIDGAGATVTVSAGIVIDLHKAGLKNTTIAYTYSNGVAPTSAVYILSLEGNAPSPTASTKMVMERVSVIGPTSRDTAPVYAYLCNPTSNIANALIDNCSASQVKSAIVFGSNSYLINFSNFTCTRYDVALTDTVVTGRETSINNAGENIRFHAGTFANGNSFAVLNGIEVTLSFSQTSFDYNGGKLGTNIKQWILGRQGINLFFTNCHFESGNVNDGITDNYFHTTAPANVTITGGWMVFGNTTYNDCPYFFYDATQGKSTFSLEGTRLFGLSIKKWASILPNKFLPAINYDASLTRATISDKSRLTIDQNFAKSIIVDDWYVGGTRTSKVDSNQASIALATTTDGDGNSIKALALSRKPSSPASVVSLNCKRPNNAFGPSVTFNIKADTEMTLSSPIFVTVYLVKGNGIRDAYGVEGITDIISTWVTNITSLSTTPQAITVRGSLGSSSTFIGYDTMIVSFNINALPNATPTVYITDVNVQQPWG